MAKFFYITSLGRLDPVLRTEFLCSTYNQLFLSPCDPVVEWVRVRHLGRTRAEEGDPAEGHKAHHGGVATVERALLTDINCKNQSCPFFMTRWCRSNTCIKYEWKICRHLNLLDEFHGLAAVDPVLVADGDGREGAGLLGGEGCLGLHCKIETEEYSSTYCNIFFGAETLIR